jgi:AhpD family alkylhydroperoxidase
MTTIKLGALALILALAASSPAHAQQAPAPPRQPAQQPQPQQQQPKAGPAQPRTPGIQRGGVTEPVLRDIEQTLGFIPQFMQAIPDTMLAGFWEAMKTFEMNPNTRLDDRTKQLIGVAVAAQIPCTYCLHFHKEAARAAGATDQDVKEAIGMAAMTRMGSTMLNGAQLDMNQFRKDVDRIMRHAKQQAAAASRQRR